MRFRQWISPTYKSLYDTCINQAPFYSNDTIKEHRPDHSYCRPWIDDPTLENALPRVQLFLNSNLTDDYVDVVDDSLKPTNENLRKIHWTPTVNTIIPETFEFETQQTNEILTQEQESFIEDVRELINETRIAALCCESNNCNVVYWRLSIHRIVSKLHSLLTHQSNCKALLNWLHEYVCKTFDRASIEHYVDLFQILYNEYPDIRALITEDHKSHPTTSLCSFVYNKLLQTPNDLTEEVIYSINLPSSPVPIVCLLIPGLNYSGHMERVQFWQRNLSQVAIVMLSAAIEKTDRAEQSKVQMAYEDILAKFNEIRQVYSKHHIMFIGWNVGCVLALKAALVCTVSSVICMSPPFQTLSEESKNDFTQINSSILFITGEKQHTDQIDHYRQRLKSRNGIIELGYCNDKLLMSENGKYRFRITQQLVDKLIMEEIVDFIAILSPRTHRTCNDDTEDENKKRRPEYMPPVMFSHADEAEEPFLYTGLNTTENTITTLTIPPEQDPNSIFLNTVLPTPTTRKRKGSTLTNAQETNRKTKVTDPANPTKRGRHRTKNLPPVDNKESKPDIHKHLLNPPNKKQTISTTSILNTLLQLPSNQPKPRTNDANIIKPIHQPPSFVNTVLSSNTFH